jgi:bacteriocin-like protein
MKEAVAMARSTDISKTTGKKKPASPDTLVKTDKTGKVELSEDELKKVSGGLKLDYKE